MLKKQRKKSATRKRNSFTPLFIDHYRKGPYNKQKKKDSYENISKERTMILRQIKENKKLFLAVLAYLATGWLLYIIRHQLIRAMYEGRSVEFLNRIIVGQSTYSLKYYFAIGDKILFSILFSVPVLVLIFLTIFKYRLAMPWFTRKEWSETFSGTIDTLPDSHLGLWIALAAGLCLYTELTILRFHSSYFRLFAFFKNISLLSCFLGLGIGYARGRERPSAMIWAFPFLALQIILMNILRLLSIETFLQNPISEQLVTSLGQPGNIFNVIFVYSFLVFIFSFNALCFIPLGQLVSHLMIRKQNLIAYSWNLVGSLLGIVLFSILSFLWTPPSVWLIFVASLLVIFFYRNLAAFLPSALALIIVLVFLSVPVRLNEMDIYSPYQILTLVFSKEDPPVLRANNNYFQRILNLRKENINNEKLKKWSDYYEFPYYFKSNPKDVLVVGSGTGNDVAAALRNGAQEIDAVEIDPAILQLGKQLHPESPYQDNKVNAIVNDARAFIRYTDKRYDLIVYGLLDSYNLLSGRGGIRMESYVYTTEAFREARTKLKDNGIISLTFNLISKEIGRKLFLMLQEAFDGHRPIVYKVNYDGGYVFLCGDKLEEFSSQPVSEFKEVTGEFADTDIHADKATDDWPFFYMPIRKYPLSYLLMILILFVASTILIHQYIPGFNKGFSTPCFFLGAGFMLLETKAITELALVYGSTWFVVSIVITGILIMAFLANFLAIKLGNPNPFITYMLLFLSLIGGLGATFLNFSCFAPFLSKLIMITVLTLPLFFSGFAFSGELKKVSSVSIALSSNLLGSMLGGFLEYNSMYFGYRSLYLIALLIYGLALLGSVRPRPS